MCSVRKKRIVSFITSVLVKSQESGIVVATSGGIDSATVLSLVVKAIGKEKSHALLLPNGDLSTTSTTRAESFIDSLQLLPENVHKIDIAPIVFAAADAFSLTEDDALRRGNIMARARMIAVFDYAKKQQLLVAGTENKSEYLLGYFTRFGDEASDFEPIRHLYKTQIYDLAKHLGVSAEIIAAKPTADLWSGQTDEAEFGFSYKDADLVLAEYFDELHSLEVIRAKYPNADAIISYTKKNHFKHEVPYLPDFMIDD
jgi:NAD+ synthase